MWYLYVLELENGCYYVGTTLNLDNRINEHQNGAGANFTKVNKPICVKETFCCNTDDRKEAYKIENAKTVEYALKYGGDKVKGGRYLVPRKLISKVAHLKKHPECIPQLPLVSGEES